MVHYLTIPLWRSPRLVGAVFAALTVGALASPAWADVREGVTAWEAGNAVQAVAVWRPLAVAGDPDAQFNLGQAYKLGRGVDHVDLAEAASWFRRAADQGHIQASDNLGLVLYELGQKGDALPWLEQSASRGEPRTQYVLAAELFNGERMSRDWPRAYALMKRASDAGLQRATAALVQMDQYIPLDQRQRGLQLASAMESSEGQARLAAMTRTAPTRPAPAPTIRTADLPPSAAGTTYAPPPADGTAGVPAAAVATAAPRPVRVAGAAMAAPARAANPAPVAPAAPAPARPVTPAPAATSAAGAWRIQLGAFATQGNAQALWARLAGRLGSAQPSYTAVGTLTRLQAGPYASRAAAESACAAIHPQACFPVAR